MLGFRRGTAALLLAVAVIGCGGKRTGIITGTVSFNGEKMEKGTVTFYTDDLKVAKGAAIHLDGTYRIEDFPVGPVKIGVLNLRNPSDLGISLGPAVKRKDGPPQRNYFDTPGKYLNIPPKYKDPAKSGLSYTVQDGTQEHNITMTP
jgi:hypothetical protein